MLYNGTRAEQGRTLPVTVLPVNRRFYKFGEMYPLYLNRAFARILGFFYFNFVQLFPKTNLHSHTYSSGLCRANLTWAALIYQRGNCWPQGTQILVLSLSVKLCWACKCNCSKGSLESTKKKLAGSLSWSQSTQVFTRHLILSQKRRKSLGWFRFFIFNLFIDRFNCTFCKCYY